LASNVFSPFTTAIKTTVTTNHTEDDEYNIPPSQQKKKNYDSDFNDSDNDEWQHYESDDTEDDKWSYQPDDTEDEGAEDDIIINDENENSSNNNDEYVPTKAEKIEYNIALEAELKVVLYELAPSQYTEEQKLEWLLSERSSMRLGLTSPHEIYETVIAKQSIKALKKYAPKVTYSWWRDRLNNALGVKCNGERFSAESQFRGGSADDADENGFGLHMLVDNPSDYIIFLECLKAGTPVDGIGKFGIFNDQSAAPYALLKVKEILKLSADETGDKVEDILLNLSIPDFISKYNSEEGYAKLREDLTAKAIEDADRLGIESVEDIQRIVSIRWLTGMNVMVNYDNIITSLVDRMAGVYPSKYNQNHIITNIKEENEKQDCIGVTKQRLGEDRVREFCRIFKTNGNYFAEIFHTNEKDPIIIDTDAKQNPTNLGADVDEDEGDEYKKNRFPGIPNRFVRRVKITRMDPESTTYTLTTYKVKLRRSDDPADNGIVTLHQLTHIILHNMGLGLHNHAGFRSFLGLEKGQSFEEVSWLSYGAGDEEYLKRRAQHLKKKGWEDVALANTSDIEHNFGRSKVWMNSSFLTFPCSHCYNRCLSYVRVIWKCWGFVSSDKRYGSGND